MSNSLKKELKEFLLGDLGLDEVGIASANDYSVEDCERIRIMRELFAQSTPIAGGDANIYQPGDFLSDAKSIVVLGANSYFGKGSDREKARKRLLGYVEESHVDSAFLGKSAKRSSEIEDFLKKRGYQCFSLSAGGFPIKLKASECGVGRYGKNAIIQNDRLGAWISLSAFITDAKMEPDEPSKDGCGKCTLCLDACPTGALEKPYFCNSKKCIDFNLGHNKNYIPEDIREACGNLLGEGCRICRDVCPHNRNLKPVKHEDMAENIISPELTSVLSISDEEWENKYAPTLFGFFLVEKRYLRRNAAIALGNFSDERATASLLEALGDDEDVVREYSAWALGKINTANSKAGLEKAFKKEKNETVQKEIKKSLDVMS